MKKRTLIYYIAKYLEVSIATLSLVPNGKAKEHRISNALAERVRRYVPEVGHKPNQLAKSLRTGKTHVIGLITEDISNPFFATVAHRWLHHCLTCRHRVGHHQFLQANPACEAIISANNSLAICGLEAIGRLGRHILAEPVVIPSDGNDLFRLHSPTITAIAQPVEALAEAVINVLLETLTVARPAVTYAVAGASRARLVGAQKQRPRRARLPGRYALLLILKNRTLRSLAYQAYACF